MPKRRYIIAAAVAVPVVVLVFLGAGYAHDEVISSDIVSRGVTAAGIELSRLPRDAAERALAAHERLLVDTPVVVIVDGKEVRLDPASVGLSIDEGDVVDDAMTVRRRGGFGNVGAWLGTWTSTTEIDVPIDYDTDAIAAQLEMWSTTAIGKPAYEGAVRIENGRAVPEYPQAGLAIDVPAAVPLIEAQLVTTDRSPVEVPLVPVAPMVTDGDVDVAVAEANALISDAVVLRAPGGTGSMVFTPAGLASALRSDVVVHSPAVVEVTLDPDTISRIAAESADQFAIPPVDASFTFDDETKTLSIVPSIRGQRVDLDAIPDVVARAAIGSDTGRLPMTEGDEAAFTTEMAEAMGPLGEVSSFTTNHPCCQTRVTNIQLLADEIRGAIVMPGEVFSINDRAGRRTLAEGYVRAGAIINGRVECCDNPANVGGGTSQFATTFYNAVFFGCYEDVFHQPHSLYFSRYPYVREATLGYPSPDVQFRNDSDAIVYIDTTYTSSSITVTFYGNNGGRTCESERDGNTITRVMTWPDGRVTRQSWTWNYKQPREDDPPPTTTTTAPPTTTVPPSSSTTTLPPDTTTTLPPDTTTTLPPDTTTTAPPTTTLPPP